MNALRHPVIGTIPVALFILLLSATAWADDSLEARSFPRKFALGLEAHGGLGTPLGYGGLAIDAQYKALSLTLGVGAGFEGTQQSAMLRVEPLRFKPRRNGDNHRIGIYLGAGVSFGPHENGSPLGPYRAAWDMAYWVNGELGVQTRFVSGFTARGYFGVSRIINRDSAVLTCSYNCDTAIPEEEVYWTLPYAGIAVGYDFY